jgi:hypothetical protein
MNDKGLCYNVNIEINTKKPYTYFFDKKKLKTLYHYLVKLKKAIMYHTKDGTKVLGTIFISLSEYDVTFLIIVFVAIIRLQHKKRRKKNTTKQKQK